MVTPEGHQRQTSLVEKGARAPSNQTAPITSSPKSPSHQGEVVKGRLLPRAVPSLREGPRV